MSRCNFPILILPIITIPLPPIPPPLPIPDLGLSFTLPSFFCPLD